MALDIARLYSVYGPMVMRRCRFLLKDEELAFDAMQEVFIKLIERKNTISKVCSSFMYKIATNVCLNKIHYENLRRTAEFDEQVSEIAEYGNNHEERIVISLFLDSVFNTMKENTRYMAVLHYIDGLTLEETAQETGMSVSGVRKRLRRLKQNMQFADILVSHQN